MFNKEDMAWPACSYHSIPAKLQTSQTPERRGEEVLTIINGEAGCVCQISCWMQRLVRHLAWLHDVSLWALCIIYAYREPRNNKLKILVMTLGIVQWPLVS